MLERVWRGVGLGLEEMTRRARRRMECSGSTPREHGGWGDGAGRVNARLARYRACLARVGRGWHGMDLSWRRDCGRAAQRAMEGDNRDWTGGAGDCFIKRRGTSAAGRAPFSPAPLAVATQRRWWIAAGKYICARSVGEVVSALWTLCCCCTHSSQALTPDVSACGCLCCLEASAISAIWRAWPSSEDGRFPRGALRWPCCDPPIHCPSV